MLNLEQVKRVASHLAAFLLYAVTTSPVIAGAIRLSETRFVLSSQRPTTTLTVLNEGDQMAVLQLQVAAWSQIDSKEVHNKTNDLIATPPIFSVPAKGRQVIRLGLRRPPDSKQELAYRLLIKEVPPPPKAGISALQIVLNFSLPIFVSPSIDANPAITIDSAKIQGDAVAFSLRNSGNAHAHISGYELSTDEAKTSEIYKEHAYLLPDQTLARELKWPGSMTKGTSIKITLHGDNDLLVTGTAMAP